MQIGFLRTDVVIVAGELLVHHNLVDDHPPLTRPELHAPQRCQRQIVFFTEIIQNICYLLFFLIKILLLKAVGGGDDPSVVDQNAAAQMTHEAHHGVQQLQ